MAGSQDESRLADLDSVGGESAGYVAAVPGATASHARAVDEELPPLEGKLFRFQRSPYPLQAFESPAKHSHSRYCLCIGGLTDGLLACSYVEALAAECDTKGWALVQPIISSSYKGYGCSSLSTDVAELAECMAYLNRTRDVTAFAIVGHSTGCQDIVHLLAKAPIEIRRLIRAAVLQAPVSDREAATLEGDAATRDALLKEAQQAIAQGQGSKLLSEMHYGFVPMTAERFASLVGRGGPDDIFSSDFTDTELVSNLGHLSTTGQHDAKGLATNPVPDHPGLKVLFVHSLGEEYVPPHVDAQLLSRRFVTAAGAPDARSLLIDGASHNLSKPEGAATKFVETVGALLDEAMDRTFKLTEDF